MFVCMEEPSDFDESGKTEKRSWWKGWWVQINMQRKINAQLKPTLEILVKCAKKDALCSRKCKI